MKRSNETRSDDISPILRKGTRRDIHQVIDVVSKALYGVVAVLAVICVGIGVDSFSNLQKTAAELDQRVESMEEDYGGLKEEYMDLVEEHLALQSSTVEMMSYIEDCEDTIDGLYTTMEQMEEQNAELLEDNIALAEENEELDSALQEQNKVDRVMTHYSYCLYDTAGRRNDVTYDQLVTMEEYAEANGVDPDLVMSIVMVESEGHEKSANSSSTARGYGQFLKGTGKWVYEDLMGNGKGTYDHSYALNGTTNLKMMTSYLGYLKRADGTWYNAIREYRGRGGSVLDSYIAGINKYLHQAGKDFYALG